MRRSNLFSRALVFIILICSQVIGETVGVEFFGKKQIITSAFQMFEPVYEDSVFPERRIELEKFFSGLKSIESLQFNQPHYWYSATLFNRTESPELALELSGSITDRIDLYLYNEQGLVYQTTGGYLFEKEYMGYVLFLPLKPDMLYRLVIDVRSRYMSGNLEFKLYEPDYLKQKHISNSAIVYLCLGAMGILGLYNLIIFVSIRDKSYLFYSLYLISMWVAWAGVFNLLTRHFDATNLWATLVTFPLGLIFSSLFVLSFLNLKASSHFYLVRVIQFFIATNAVAVMIFPFISAYFEYYLFIVFGSSVWLLLALGSSIYRFAQGFKPARFIIVGFFVLLAGSSFSLLPGFGIEPPIEDFFVVTLIAMTLDMVFLAIALADRINLLRIERAQALESAYQKDIKMLQVEQVANSKLMESNEKLKQSLEISERADEKKKQFLMVASHELRTPLNAMADAVANLDSGKMNEESLQFIQHGTETLSILVDQLTIFAELAEHSMESKPVEFDVGSLMKKLESMVGRLTADKNIKVDWICEDAHHIEIDGYLLEVALKPIIDNACKFSNGEPVRVTYLYDQTVNMARWIIEDGGQGIDSALQEKLTMVFEQESYGFSRAHEGMGLGLFITQKALKPMGGSIEFSQSEDLGGAKFIVEIPAERISAGRQPLGCVNRVLVVEDNPVNAKVMESILKTLHVTTVLAVNGLDALEKSKSDRFDLVLMDLQMPVMNGFDATEAMKLRNDQTPIIAVTANSEQDARQRCLALGMMDILIKPVRRSEVEDCLKRWGGRLPDPAVKLDVVYKNN